MNPTTRRRPVRYVRVSARNGYLRGILFTGTFIAALLVGVFFGDIPDTSATAVVLLLGLLGTGILFLPA